MFYISNLNGYIRPCRRVLVLGAFLKPTTQLQRTRSRRSLNRFWCFLVQNKVESLLVLFLLFPVHFCWVESTKNFQWSKRLCFFRAQIPKVEANLLVDAGGNTWKINDILREIKIVRSGSLNQQEKLLQTKYQLNRSIFATCMPKKINPPKNLGIKSLTTDLARDLVTGATLFRLHKIQRNRAHRVANSKSYNFEFKVTLWSYKVIY